MYLTKVGGGSKARGALDFKKWGAQAWEPYISLRLWDLEDKVPQKLKQFADIVYRFRL